jgi:hypothetical protein
VMARVCPLGIRARMDLPVAWEAINSCRLISCASLVARAVLHALAPRDDFCRAPSCRTGIDSATHT